MSAPWLKFYPSDWRADPALRMCSIGARGLWMEMLCIMHEAEPYGSLRVNGRPVSDRQMAGLAGASPDEVEPWLAELEGAGVFSRDEDGAIVSRRMMRDKAKADRDKANGETGGAPNVRRGTAPKSERVRPYRKADAPEKTRRIWAASGGRCFWCDVGLCQEPKSEEDYAQGFHVDHLVPVSDGGSNDERNLVASCAVCNHDRSKVGWPENSRRNVDPTLTRRKDPLFSDTNPQKPEARDQNPDQDKSVPNGTTPQDGAPIMDAKDRLWADGPVALESFGVAAKRARPIIGKWLRDAGDNAGLVLEAIQRAEQQRIVDPVPWITQAIAKSTGPPGPRRMSHPTIDQHGNPINDQRPRSARAQYTDAFAAGLAEAERALGR